MLRRARAERSPFAPPRQGHDRDFQVYWMLAHGPFRLSWQVAGLVVIGGEADIRQGTQNDAIDPFRHFRPLNCCCAKNCRTPPRGQGTPGTMVLQAIQEVDQIGFLLIGETDREALIVEIHDVL